MRVYGLDFGTTNSCITVFDYSQQTIQPVIIQNPNGNNTTPTALFFNPIDNDIAFGENALMLSNLKGQTITNWKRILGLKYDQLPENIILFFKEKGTEIHDVLNQPTFKVQFNDCDKVYSAKDLTIMYLKWMLSWACQEKQPKVVITIPAYFNNNQRETLQQSAEDAGFQVVKIINEPTAAALAYGYNDTQHQTKENVLVFDCGGGTTDLSLLEIDHENVIYQIKDVVGDNFLGGSDIDNIVCEYLEKKANLKSKKFKVIKKLRQEAETCKIALSKMESYTILQESLENDQDFKCIVSRALFMEIIKPIVKKINDLIDKLEECTNISRVVFVGGSTKLFCCKDIIKNKIRKDIIICDSIDPDLSVAIGACINCISLTKEESTSENFVGDLLLMDITPLGFGVETEGGLMETVVYRNTCIPVVRTKNLTNSEDGITQIKISVYQGESRFCKFNFLIGEFTLTGLNPVFDRGQMNIVVQFNINSSGILQVSARELASASESLLIIRKETITTNIPDDLEDLILNSEYTKAVETELANKILARIEFQQKYKQLMTIYKEKRSLFYESEDFDQNNNQNFTIFKFDTLFEKAFDILVDALNSTGVEIKEKQKMFEEEWHETMFEFTGTNENEGSTKIKDLDEN